MSVKSVDSELSMLERETLRRGCLTLESAAHEESFCVWHLVRFLSRNRILDLEADADDSKTDPGNDSGCSSINQPFMDAHGRAAVRGAQVTNSVWVVLAKLARVIVCGPEHVPVDQLALRNPSYYKRLTELHALFDEEKANLDRYCAAHAATPLFPEGALSSTALLRDIQQGAELCAQHLRTTLRLRGRQGAGADTTSWHTCTRLLEATLDMSWDAGGFLDVVSWMIFGTGSAQPRPHVPLIRALSAPPPRAIPLVVRADKNNEKKETAQKQKPLPPPPPDILSKATTTTQITVPGSPTSIGEQAYSVGPASRRGSSIIALPQTTTTGSKFTEDLSTRSHESVLAGASATADTAKQAETADAEAQHTAAERPAGTGTVSKPRPEDKSRLRSFFVRKKK